jgi:hypothetical protein
LQRPGNQVARFNYPINSPIQIYFVRAELFHFGSIVDIWLRFFYLKVFNKNEDEEILLGNNFWVLTHVEIAEFRWPLELLQIEDVLLNHLQFVD